MRCASDASFKVRSLRHISPGQEYRDVNYFTVGQHLRHSRGRSYCAVTATTSLNIPAPGIGHVAARSKRTRRNVASYFVRERTSFRQSAFIVGGRASLEASVCLSFGTDRYDTLASAEALATVLVIVPVAAGAIMLAESRRISGRGQIGPACLERVKMRRTQREQL